MLLLYNSDRLNLLLSIHSNIAEAKKENKHNHRHAPTQSILQNSIVDSWRVDNSNSRLSFLLSNPGVDKLCFMLCDTGRKARNIESHNFMRCWKGTKANKNTTRKTHTNRRRNLPTFNKSSIIYPIYLGTYSSSSSTKYIHNLIHCYHRYYPMDGFIERGSINIRCEYLRLA